MAEFQIRKIKRERESTAREKKNAYERERRAHIGHRWIKIKSRYGITKEDFERIAEEQGGLCACCRVRLPVDIDHCHSTNQLRGLLCRACNIGIGLLGDDIDGILRAVAYLRNGGTENIVPFAPVKKDDEHS